MPFAYLVLLVAFVLGVIGLGVYAALELPRLLSSNGKQPQRLGASGAVRAPRPSLLGGSRRADWLSGNDLLHYPSRLAELEVKLETSHRAVNDQIEYLRIQRDKISAKEDRDELAARYEDDAQMLDRRAERMRRVMGLVWRTRAVLLLRAHVAITARHRPQVEQLPEGTIPPEGLERAATAYENSASAVREFVRQIMERTADLGLTVPPPGKASEVTEEDHASVDAELARARVTYEELNGQMDRLADTLAYLSDRCRTRQVVEGAPAGLVAEPGTEGLVDEVNTALSALNDLADLGDRQLADTAMDNLAEDISQLERAGLEAQAEADAALEVARLLEQFPA